MTPYESIAHFVQIASLLYFVALFIAVIAYALRPRNKKTFDEAASIPLRED